MISSRSNPTIRRLRRCRRERGATAVLEGPDLIAEAAAAAIPLETVLATPEFLASAEARRLQGARRAAAAGRLRRPAGRARRRRQPAGRPRRGRSAAPGARGSAGGRRGLSLSRRRPAAGQSRRPGAGGGGVRASVAWRWPPARSIPTTRAPCAPRPAAFCACRWRWASRRPRLARRLAPRPATLGRPRSARRHRPVARRAAGQRRPGAGRRRAGAVGRNRRAGRPAAERRHGTRRSSRST